MLACFLLRTVLIILIEILLTRSVSLMAMSGKCYSLRSANGSTIVTKLNATKPQLHQCRCPKEVLNWTTLFLQTMNGISRPYLLIRQEFFYHFPFPHVLHNPPIDRPRTGPISHTHKTMGSMVTDRESASIYVLASITP